MKPVVTLILTVISFAAAAQLQFGQSVVPPIWGMPWSITVGDFDGNGRDDVALTLQPFGALK